MRIGYHFWGFLGPGIADTSDDGRPHRRILIDALLEAGHDVVFLQIDRDLADAGDRLDGRYTFDVGFPDLEALILEWRRPIPGRNTTPCGRPGHTCDLHRQQSLVARYTVADGLPTIVWDRDLALPEADGLRALPNAAVAEPTLRPRAGAVRLLFPVAESALDDADPQALIQRHRGLPLVFAGDQDGCEDAFERYFAPAAARFRHRVAGRWPQAARWPHARFTGRLPMAESTGLYAGALATVLLAPHGHHVAGHVAPRLPGAVLSGCLPIVPAALSDAETLSPVALHANDGTEVIDLLEHLVAVAGTSEHGELVADCLKRLDLFRVSRQIAVIEAILDDLPPR